MLSQTLLKPSFTGLVNAISVGCFLGKFCFPSFSSIWNEVMVCEVHHQLAMRLPHVKDRKTEKLKRSWGPSWHCSSHWSVPAYLPLDFLFCDRKIPYLYKPWLSMFSITWGKHILLINLTYWKIVFLPSCFIGVLVINRILGWWSFSFRMLRTCSPLSFSFQCCWEFLYPL